MLISTPGLCHLTALILDTTGTDDNVMRLAGLHLAGLSRLWVTNCPMTNIGMDHLSSLTRLRVLKFVQCYNLTDDGLRAIASHTALTTLSLCHHSPYMASIAQDNRVEMHTIQTTELLRGVGTCGMQHIHGLTNLTSLKVNHPMVLSPAAIRVIGDFTRLTDLDVDVGYLIDDESIGVISNLSRLTELRLNGLRIGATLEPLLALTSLSELCLAHGGVQGSDLLGMTRLTRLTALNVQASLLLDATAVQIFFGRACKMSLQYVNVASVQLPTIYGSGSGWLRLDRTSHPGFVTVRNTEGDIVTRV